MIDKSLLLQHWICEHIFANIVECGLTGNEYLDICESFYILAFLKESY